MRLLVKLASVLVVTRMKQDLDVLALPLNDRSTLRSLTVPHKRPPQLLLFNPGRDQVVRVLNLLRIPEKVLDQVRAVIFQVVTFCRRRVSIQFPLRFWVVMVRKSSWVGSSPLIYVVLCLGDGVLASSSRCSDCIFCQPRLGIPHPQGRIGI